MKHLTIFLDLSFMQLEPKIDLSAIQIQLLYTINKIMLYRAATFAYHTQSVDHLV